MADFHKYKFLYGANQSYADGYDRIFGGSKHEVDSEGDKKAGRVQRKGKKGTQKRKGLRRTGTKKRV